MKIYTKTGDKGKTSLLGGKKVAKSHYRITSYGDVDELNSFVGLLKDQPGITQELLRQLNWIQEHLFTIGSILATEKDFSGFKLPEIQKNHIQKLEIWIDEFTAELPELKSFILPGGHPTVSYCHICRTVCRRAERSIIALDSEEQVNENIVPFVNRLSDYFFVMSRKMAQLLKVSETPWVPGASD